MTIPAQPDNGRSVITFDHDRVGGGAVVARLTAACDPRGATQVIPDQPGVRRYILVEQLGPEFSVTRLDVFPGGCLTTRMTAPAAGRAGLTSEASLVLGLTTRQTLQQALDQRSEGRLHLDPR
jgi:hypothetical protein